MNLTTRLRSYAMTMRREGASTCPSSELDAAADKIEALEKRIRIARDVLNGKRRKPRSEGGRT